MCVVSAIGNEWAKTVPDRYPGIYPWANPPLPKPTPPAQYATQAEVRELARELKELRALLIAAKKFDAATGQGDCEMDEKVALIKRMAELVGVDMSDVFDKEKS